MSKTSRWMVLITVGSMMSGVAFGHGDVSCNVPRAEWKARVDLQKQLKRLNWTVRDIKITNGCYEVYGFDEKDRKIEAFFNPKTFERVMPADALPAAAR